MLKNLKNHQLLKNTLISHDAGWYSPGEAKGGNFSGFTPIFDTFIPLLLKEGFTEKEIDLLIKTNPMKSFSIKVRKL